MNPTTLSRIADLTRYLVGLSRVHSHDHQFPPHVKPSEDGYFHDSYRARPRHNGIPAVMSTATDHHPFTEHDLALALQRSHLTIPAS